MRQARWSIDFSGSEILGEERPTTEDGPTEIKNGHQSTLNKSKTPALKFQTEKKVSFGLTSKHILSTLSALTSTRTLTSGNRATS